METHPDRNGGASTDAFPEVTEAFEVLSDPAKREAWEHAYRDRAKSLGHVVCDSCFAVVRLRKFRKHEKPKCGECRRPLSVTAEEREHLFRDAMAYQLGELVNAIGAEGASLAKDAIVAGADSIRRKLGLKRSGEDA